MRLIDADALYKNLGFAEECKDCDHQYNSVFCESSTWQVVCDAIYEAPTVYAVPRWIPCEEKLPNEDEIIYNGVVIDGERRLSDRVLAINHNGFIRAGYFIKSCKPHKYNGKGAKNKYSEPLVSCWEFGEHYMSDPSNLVCGCGFDAVAWMPLPDPYEGERKDDE